MQSQALDTSHYIGHDIIVKDIYKMALPATIPRHHKVIELSVADGLSLAAAPTFGFMAALTRILDGGAQEFLCSAGPYFSALNGMTVMYLMMGLFHLVPWLKLISGRRERVDARTFKTG